MFILFQFIRAELGILEMSYKKYFIYVIVIFLLLIASFSIGRLTVLINNSPAADTLQKTPEYKIKQTINKDFNFPLKDGQGKKIGNIKYNMQDAQLQNEIVIKGQKATAVKEKIFLIINLKITNNTNKGIQINTRDYVRLTVNNKNEMLAPEIHNDPVEVQAISTKYVRLGFPINISDKNLKLLVGEINNKKTAIDLNLK